MTTKKKKGTGGRELQVPRGGYYAQPGSVANDEEAEGQDAESVSIGPQVLRKRKVPLPMKMSVMRGVVMPRLLFGAEVYGMGKMTMDNMQTMVNRALPKVVGLSAKAMVSNVARWRETGVPPLVATTAGRRVRAYQKTCTLNTWVRRLVDNPFNSRRRTCLSGTARWLESNTHKLVSFLPKATGIPNVVWKRGGWKKLGAKLTNAIVTKAVWAR